MTEGQRIAEETDGAPRAETARRIDAALAEQAKWLRQRMFGNRRADRSDHTTACSIWGDDGQGHTAEQFPEPLPCNCGALENWAKEKLAEREAQITYLIGWIRCAHHDPTSGTVCDHTRDKIDALIPTAARFVERVRSEERERCAKVAEDDPMARVACEANNCAGARDIAAAIRILK